MGIKRVVPWLLLIVLVLPILAACGANTGGGTGAGATAGAGGGDAGAGATAGAGGGETGAAATTAAGGDAETETATADAGGAAAGGAETATAGAGGTAAGGAETATAGAGGAAAGPGPATGRPSVDPATIGEELANAYNGDYRGMTVTMMGPFVDVDAEKFAEAMRPFEEATGIDIQYEGTKEFESIINVRVEGGTPPDIADIPQPGLNASFAQAGKVQDVSQWINQDWLNQNYNQGYIDTATVAGPNGDILGGVFHRVFPKSLVWYPKDDWDEAGYEIPETWDEMKTLMDEIVADGDTPWCIGIESGTATGWPATDWMEEIMLRTTSLENYDRWTSGEMPFTDPVVKNAAQVMAEIWTNDQYVYGGRQQIISTSFGDSVQPMFQDPPKCWLHKQGNFITSFFPEEAQAGVDYDFFYLPPIDEQYGKPVLFSGDLMTAFTDRPEVRAVMQYFTTFDSLKGWVATGGALSPHNDQVVSAFGSEVERQVAEILAEADSVRFDGSDLMPGAVGAGTFWKAMTDFVSGSADLDQAMETAQQGWSNVQR
ncbi:MAG TPA: ABC transporter substrate-binding protein [Herpetosiphonaceae bacterium]|nr:ABC transporter substrate-binding protein [Herpetosiphonaceae bacterium]